MGKSYDSGIQPAGFSANDATNPIVEAIRSAGGDFKPIVVHGYPQEQAPVGTAPAVVHIFVSLQNLSGWHEVESTDILYQVIPQNPLSPTTFFLKSTAKTAHRRPVNYADQSRFIGGSLIANHYRPSGDTEGAGGPLNRALINATVATGGICEVIQAITHLLSADHKIHPYMATSAHCG